MGWFFWASSVFIFLIFVVLSWPTISTWWWLSKRRWIEASQKRLDFFTRQDKDLERILAEAMQRAQDIGLPEYAVSIRMIKWFLVPLFDGESITSEDDLDRNKIYISEFWILKQKYKEDDLRILIAHELGHIIDDRTKRIGHPALEDKKHLNEEDFADFIAQLLYPGVTTFVIPVKSVKLST